MPRYAMSWVASTCRWKKMKDGKVYVVSCRQLGVPETKEASWKAANFWWEEQEKKIGLPAEDAELVRRARVRSIQKDFGSMDEATRREVVDALLGAGSYQSLVSAADGLVAHIDAPAKGREVSTYSGQWQSFLRSICQAGQMSEGRFDAYCRRVRPFTDYLGDVAIDQIDESRLEGYFGHLSHQMSEGRYSPSTAHEMMMTAKQFIRWLAERKLIPLPGNIDSRRFRFNHSAAAEIEVFTVAEVRQLLGKANGRTRLFLLLMLNCGHYQSDIADLLDKEVDWKAGTLRRARSKTRDRGGPVVTYKLWPETLALLKEHRSGGERVLLTEKGNPLVSYQLKDGKLSRYDAIQSSYNRMGKGRLPLKHLRKTSASLLAQHPSFKFYANHFLADSPKSVADRHYVVPSDAEFFDALDWLRGQVLAEGGDLATQPLLDQEA